MNRASLIDVVTVVLALAGAHCAQPTVPAAEDASAPTNPPATVAFTGPAAPTVPPSHPTTTPSVSVAPPASITPPGAVCASRASVRMPTGATVSCYPYGCRNGACLKRCSSELDCAGAHTPAEMAEHGYPLECMPSGECVPMPPEKVAP